MSNGHLNKQNALIIHAQVPPVLPPFFLKCNCTELDFNSVYFMYIKMEVYGYMIGLSSLFPAIVVFGSSFYFLADIFAVMKIVT